ncbi:hypothetical protein BC829DRAFT_387675 [Chytridium lagenaria]|nr:hypothetical protein BC829DRAFT_387675 [Chytridium lagenaria]
MASSTFLINTGGSDAQSTHSAAPLRSDSDRLQEPQDSHPSLSTAHPSATCPVMGNPTPPPPTGGRFSIRNILTQIRKPNTFLGCLELAPGTTALNFSAYLLATFFNICLFVFLNSSQTFVLTQVLRIPTNTIGDVSGTLTFADEILSLIAVWCWGLHLTLLGGSLFGGAAASSMLTAVLADYASDKDRGKSSGLVGLTSGLGALLALFVFLRLPANFSDVVRGLRITYLLVAGISFIFAIFLIFALKSTRKPVSEVVTASAEPLAIETPVPVSPSGSDDESEPKKPEADFCGVVGLAWEGIKAAKNPRILLGYVGASLARGGTVIITLFLPLWVYKSYIDSGLCQAPSPDDPDIKDICRAAYLRASTLSGVTQTFALIGAPFFGFLGDYFYGPFATTFAGALGIFSKFTYSTLFSTH